LICQGTDGGIFKTTEVQVRSDRTATVAWGDSPLLGYIVDCLDSQNYFCGKQQKGIKLDRYVVSVSWIIEWKVCSLTKLFDSRVQRSFTESDSIWGIIPRVLCEGYVKETKVLLLVLKINQSLMHM
jgi:hypothetical protein